MPLNYAYAWLRSKRIAKALQHQGLTKPHANTPIIYIPGILGTKLFDTQQRVNIWGSPSTLLAPKADYAPFALDERALTAWQDHDQERAQRVIATEQLHAFSIIPKLVDTLVTSELRSVLHNALDYQEGRDLFFLGHDWRQDYRLMSVQIEQQIERIEQRFGKGCPFIFIGQSVANQGIQFWAHQASAERLAQVQRWYSFGPTWQGTFHALSMMHEGYYPASKKFKGFTPADVASFPSTYQLLHQKPRVIDAQGKTLAFSFYDVDCWQEYGLGPWHTNLRDHLNVEQLTSYLALAKEFTQTINSAKEKIARIPQVWYLGDANQAVLQAVVLGKRLLSSAAEIRQHAPELQHLALAKGDDHLPIEDFAEQPNGCFVRDYQNIPYGERYMLVGQAKDHRSLINYGRNLKAIAFDIATVRQQN